MNNRKRTISIRTRLIIWVLSIIIVMGMTGILAVRYFANDIVSKYYIDKASKLANTVAVSLDPEDVYTLKAKVMDIYRSVDEPVLSDEWGTDAFNSYISLYSGIEKLPEYQSVRDDIRTYQDINDVDSVYIGIMDFDSERGIYLVDGAYEDACPPGCVDQMPEEGKASIDAPEEGFPPYISNTVYGWLITAGAPIYYNGNVIAYALTDIAMSEIKQKQISFVIFMAGVMLLISFVTIFWGMKVITEYILDPINKLAVTAERYCSETTDFYHHSFGRISLRNDEIGNLLRSMQQMERDMNENIESLISTKSELKETITKVEEITDAAMKDPLTKAGSKIAYEEAVNRLALDMMSPDCRFGIVMIDLNLLKTINDTYGHEYGDIAIKNLSDTVCGIFRESQVYRIGGDEFVVIVRGREYDNADRLISKLKSSLDRKGEGSRPYEDISAAVGYAVYSEEDEEYKDVFKRADDDMYKNKKKMHGRDR